MEVDGHEVEEVGEEAEPPLAGLQQGGEVRHLQPPQAPHHAAVVRAPHQLPPAQLREDAFAVVLDRHLCTYIILLYFLYEALRNDDMH